VRDEANGKTVKARVGDRIELILSSTYWNPVTLVVGARD
jgi:hypothetical protein